ncbi:GAF domain-containing protein [Fulvimarina sp. MAC3]|uniref:GAF domain-containing protein n=1 Tax=Fulvimarina sp. MAC3 TaxID=3148887 RepID=UPI0031FE0065
MTRGSDRSGNLIDWRVLGKQPEAEFDRITRLAARFLSVPVAYISIVEPDRQIYKSALGLPTHLAERRESPISHSLCRHVVASGKPLIAPDVREISWLKDSPAIQDIGVVACLGTPIRLPSGEVIGSLCVVDHQRRNWSENEIATAEDLAELVSQQIALRYEVAARETAEEELLLVARELQHRTRNAFSIVQAVISLSMRDRSLIPLKLDIIDKISTVASTQELIAQQSGGSVDFSQMLRRELSPLASEDQFTISGPRIDVAANEAVFVGMILHELTTNAVKYGALRTESKGRMFVEWSTETDHDVQTVRLIWKEIGLDPSATGSPKTGDDSKPGFGSELLQILVTNQLRGTMTRTLADDSLTIEMALRLIVPPADGRSPTSDRTAV